MKKFTVAVFVFAVLLMLGMTACSSYPKLDLSTLDRSQPIPVRLIALYCAPSINQEFFNIYGNSLKNPSATLEKADADKLLQIVCGTVAKNWESISGRVKTETGITLDGTRFMQELKDGNSARIMSQEQMAFNKLYQYIYSWEGGTAGGLEDTIATIDLHFDSSLNEVIPTRVNIQTFGEEDELGIKKMSGLYKMSLR